jgi:glycosyltransferase involved in cell wall biosynthesis
MKVAVFHNLPSGGAKRALYGLAKQLHRAGCTLDVLVPAGTDEAYLSLRDLARNVEVFPVRPTLSGIVTSTLRYLPPIVPLRVSLADLERTQRRIAAAIDERDYDVVFVEQDQYTMSPFLLKFLHTPHVYYCQQPCRQQDRVKEVLLRQGRTQRAPLLRIDLARHYAEARLVHIDRDNAAAARTILANSYFSREAILRAYGVNASVSYLGVDHETFGRRDDDDADYVLSVGYIGPMKGQDFVVRALARIEPRRRPRLVLAANGADAGWRRHLEALAARARVTLDIRVLVSDPELVQLYNRARVFVYGAYLEPFGLAPLEAMACGTAVVAVKEGGLRESIVEGETGRLVERDEEPFAAAVSELLADEGQRRKLGRAAAEDVRERWTMEHAGARLLGHLQRAAGGRPEQSGFPRGAERA